MRDLKRRIRGVRSTQQITRAMEMVAAAKLRRAQQQLTTGLPFTEKLETILSRVVQHRDVLQRKDAVHPLLAVREPARVLYVVVAADRGLAGGYNTNVLRLALATIQEDEREKRVVAVGRRSRDFLLRRGIELYNEGLQSNYIYVGDELSYRNRGSSALHRRHVHPRRGRRGDHHPQRLPHRGFVSSHRGAPFAHRTGALHT